jgi:c-di-GMP-related signal transduction protein
MEQEKANKFLAEKCYRELHEPYTPSDEMKKMFTFKDFDEFRDPKGKVSVYGITYHDAVSAMSKMQNFLYHLSRFIHTGEDWEKAKKLFWEVHQGMFSVDFNIIQHQMHEAFQFMHVEILKERAKEHVVEPVVEEKEEVSLATRNCEYCGNVWEGHSETCPDCGNIATVIADGEVKDDTE